MLPCAFKIDANFLGLHGEKGRSERCYNHSKKSRSSKCHSPTIIRCSITSLSPPSGLPAKIRTGNGGPAFNCECRKVSLAERGGCDRVVNLVFRVLEFPIVRVASDLVEHNDCAGEHMSLGVTTHGGFVRRSVLCPSSVTVRTDAGKRGATGRMIKKKSGRTANIPSLWLR